MNSEHLTYCRVKAALVGQGIPPLKITRDFDFRTFDPTMPLLTATRVLMAIEDEFGISFSDDEADSMITVRNITEFLETRSIV